ncbi:MAG: RNA polymerase subunit sigma-70 [bacterium]
MTNQQREKITELRGQGLGYTAIANAVGLSKDSVKAYCRSHHLGKNTDNSADYSPAQLCLHCGKELVHTPGKREKKFCCPECRQAWWNSHPQEVRRRAIYSFTCRHCGKPFTAYGNSRRKYCCHDCYISDRFRGGDGR